MLGDEPTVIAMQEQMAAFFGKEAALLMPSGTMSNLVSLMTNVRTKGHTAIIGRKCHIHDYERGGMAALGSIFPHVISVKSDGTFDLKELEACVPIENEHLARPAVICMENSHGCCNGAAVPLSHVKDVAKIAKKHKLRMHLDGARLLNALIASNDDPKEYTSYFTTVSFCLSKGMGCPIGSVLLGTHEDMKFAKNIRKMLGGGLRQAGIIAACMQVAMEDWRKVLTADNANCKWAAKAINSIDGASVDLASVHTNMFSFVLDATV